MRKKDIDLVDIQILQLLSHDANITNKDLAEKIGLSPGPTLVRVQNLIQKQAIHRYRIEINPRYFGYDKMVGCRLIVLVEHIDEILQRLSENNKIVGLSIAVSPDASQKANEIVKFIMFAIHSKNFTETQVKLTQLFKNMDGIIDKEIYQLHMTTDKVFCVDKEDLR
jgi:DNA-binding Lrp family transcriptional regulator